MPEYLSACFSCCQHIQVNLTMIHVIWIMEYTVWRVGGYHSFKKGHTHTETDICRMLPFLPRSFSGILRSSRDLGVMLPYLADTYIDTTVTVTRNKALFSMRVAALANNWYPWIDNDEVADHQTPKFHLSKSFSLSVS